MNILILGISGMLGNILFKYLTSLKRHEVFGTIRSLEDKKFFTNIDDKKINILDNINKFENISNLIKKYSFRGYEKFSCVFKKLETKS